MRRVSLLVVSAGFLLVAGGASWAAGGGGGGGSGDSGGENPYGGDSFRQDEMRPQLKPETRNDYEAGLTALQQHQYVDAIVHLTLALPQRPNDATILFELGYANHMLGQAAAGATRDADYKLALGYYHRSLTVDPDSRIAHRYLGTLALQLHDQAAAAGELKALETLCPSGCDERDSLAKAEDAYQAALNAATPPTTK